MIDPVLPEAVGVELSVVLYKKSCCPLNVLFADRLEFPRENPDPMSEICPDKKSRLHASTVKVAMGLRIYLTNALTRGTN